MITFPRTGPAETSPPPAASLGQRRQRSVDDLRAIRRRRRMRPDPWAGQRWAAAWPLAREPRACWARGGRLAEAIGTGLDGRRRSGSRSTDESTSCSGAPPWRSAPSAPPPGQLLGERLLHEGRECLLEKIAPRSPGTGAVLLELGAPLVALGRILRQRLEHDLLHALGDVRVELPRRAIWALRTLSTTEKSDSPTNSRSPVSIS